MKEFKDLNWYWQVFIVGVIIKISILAIVTIGFAIKYFIKG